MSNKIQVLKIGGSLLTDKFAGGPTFSTENARRLAAEIAELTTLPIVVHGTGSYGKPPAKTYGYLNGFLSSDQANVVSSVSGMLEELRQKVIDAFRYAGLSVVGLSAGSLFTTRNGVIVECAWQPVVAFIERGIIPIICGDFVVDLEQDFAVCSSDWIASHLAISARAQRLIFATDVPGVIMPDGADSSQDISRGDYAFLRKALHDSQDDVSHGMDGKLRAGFWAGEHDVAVYLVDGTVPGNVTRALTDQTPQSTRLLSLDSKLVAPDVH